MGRFPGTSVTDGWDKLLKDVFLQNEHGALWWGRDGVLGLGIAGLEDVGILARCKCTHWTNHPCQSAGFPEGWLGSSWGYRGPALQITTILSWPSLNRIFHHSQWTKNTTLTGVKSESTYATLESHLRLPPRLWWWAISRWNNREDKGISLKDFLLSFRGLYWSWFMFVMHTGFYELSLPCSLF